MKFHCSSSPLGIVCVCVTETLPTQSIYSIKCCVDRKCKTLFKIYSHPKCNGSRIYRWKIWFGGDIRACKLVFDDTITNHSFSFHSPKFSTLYAFQTIFGQLVNLFYLFRPNGMWNSIWIFHTKKNPSFWRLCQFIQYSVFWCIMCVLHNCRTCLVKYS